MDLSRVSADGNTLPHVHDLLRIDHEADLKRLFAAAAAAKADVEGADAAAAAASAVAAVANAAAAAANATAAAAHATLESAKSALAALMEYASSSDGDRIAASTSSVSYSRNLIPTVTQTRTS